MRILLLTLFVLALASHSDAKEQPQAGSWHSLENQFTIPELSRKRTLRVYLPPAYYQAERRFAVLYMHDAQNLFDDSTAFAGEWQVDENLNALAKEKGLQLIVVGIDNGGEHRTTELSAWTHEKYGQGEGQHYTDFIVKVVKPYIDQHYKTLKDAQNTAIMGSSMGGLASHYAIYRYPEVFSKAGIFSPSYWYTEQVFQFTQQHPVPKQHRLYFIVGGKEGEDMVQPMNQMQQLISEQGHPQQHIQAKVIADGQHNEAFWRVHFSDAIEWLFNPL